MGASRAYAPSPSRQLTRPGRLRAEETPPVFRTRYAAVRFLFSTTRKPFCRRSTATRYATIFRATASVARLALPFCFSCSYTIASSGLFRGAIFAASIRTVCRCLLRCFDSGVRMVILAELLSAPHSQQYRNLVLHLYRLADQQVPVAQGAPSFANLRRGHVALRQKIAAQAVGNLFGIDAVVLFLSHRNRS